MHLCVSVYMFLSVCQCMCYPGQFYKVWWSQQSSSKSVLFAVCWGSTLLTPQDPDTAGMDWLAFAFAAVLLLVVKGGLFLHRCGSPEEMERLLMRFCKTEFSLESLLQEWLKNMLIHFIVKYRWEPVCCQFNRAEMEKNSLAVSRHKSVYHHIKHVSGLQKCW